MRICETMVLPKTKAKDFACKNEEDSFKYKAARVERDNILHF